MQGEAQIGLVHDFRQLLPYSTRSLVFAALSEVSRSSLISSSSCAARYFPASLRSGPPPPMCRLLGHGVAVGLLSHFLFNSLVVPLASRKPGTVSRPFLIDLFGPPKRSIMRRRS